MATIDITVKGLTGEFIELSVDDAVVTINDLPALLRSVEGNVDWVDAYYGNIFLETNPSINTTNNGSDTLADAGVLDGAFLLAKARDTAGMTKEDRQVQKLDIAAAKRNESYDLTQLPTRYSGNDVVDNPNPDGLIQGRPWA
jgi:hypothetical protein